MDWISPLRNISLSSIAIPSVLFYAQVKSPRFYLEPRFYIAVYISWLLQFLLWAIYRVLVYPKLLSPLRHLPEPTEGRSWWNGFTKRVFSGMRGSTIAEWQRSLSHNGVFRYLGLLNSERLVFTSPEAVVDVLHRTDEFIQPKLLSLFASPITGRGLVLLNGEEHKRHRKLLQPSFSPKQIRTLHPIFWTKALEVTDVVSRIIDDTAAASGFSAPIEVDHYAGLVGLDVIGTAALGVNFNAVQQPDGDFVHYYRNTFIPTLIFQAMAFMRLLLPRTIVEAIPLRRIREAKTSIRLLRKACRDSVRHKKALLAANKLDTNDIISALLRDRQVSDEEELLVHMMMMLGAGHETVAVAITWALYELCRHPQWQEDIRSEVRAYLLVYEKGKSPEAPKFDPDNTPRLNAFVSEVLRYWPPAPQVVRTAAVDTTVAGVAVPASTKVQLSIVAFNRDPANWGSSAREFNPSRWLRESNISTDKNNSHPLYNATAGSVHKHAFMTFIHGPRDCIGRGFARQEILSVLATWVARFQFVLTEKAYMDERQIPISGGGLTAKPLHGIHVHARHVPGW